MKELPILFSNMMVQAILEGRKSQTRRILKEKHVLYSLDVNKVIPEYFKDGDGGWCPYGKPGDILWVREKFCYGRIAVGELSDGRDSKPYVSQCTGEKDFIPYEYCIADDIGIQDVAWKPSIHMRKENARIWLKVESVRVERVQDITEADAILEGVEKLPGSGSSTRFNYKHYDYELSYNVDAKVSFRTLWEKINGADSWAANPWVWVVSFTVLSTTGKPDLKQ